MNIAQITNSLRDTSERYGGLPEYLFAAGELERAAGAFFRQQSLESLAELNSAVARVAKLNMAFSGAVHRESCRTDNVAYVNFRS